VEAFNARLDAVVAGVFLLLVATVVASAGRQWRLVLRGDVPVAPDEPPRGGGGEAVLGDVPSVGGRTRCC
jgi:hypothetical protein